jgi:hypothetical protein
MDSTGPTGTNEVVEHENTGPTGTVEPVENTGPTGTVEPVELENTGPTGPIGPVFPEPGPPPMLIDISELLSSHAGIKQQEITDRSTLSILLNLPRDSIRTSIIRWTELGFPPIYILQQLTVTPPAVCSDGVSRSLYDYITYLLGQDMAAINTSIQALCVGVLISYSFQGNTVRIHVSRT